MVLGDLLIKLNVNLDRLNKGRIVNRIVILGIMLIVLMFVSNVMLVVKVVVELVWINVLNAKQERNYREMYVSKIVIMGIMLIVRISVNNAILLVLNVMGLDKINVLNVL